MTDSLATELHTSNMLLINDLHAFDFVFDANGLKVECMDGRDLKRWQFSPEQVGAATKNADAQSWSISDDKGEHRLICVQAFDGGDEDEPAEQE